MQTHYLVRSLTIAMLAAGMAVADDWNKSYQVTAKPDVRVETDDGSVTVRAGEQATVSAHVTTKGWTIGPGEVQVNEQQDGNSISLVVKTPRRNWSGNRSVHVELTVPKESALNVKTGDGGVHVTGISGNVRLNTGDGGIDADGVDGSLEARTGDGHIKVQGRFDLLALNTGDGGVEAQVGPGSKVASPWRVETGDGGVTLHLPRDLNADLDAHTGDGHIAVDVPLTLPGGGKIDEHHIRGKLNSGGLPLTVHTGDGGIRIAQR